MARRTHRLSGAERALAALCGASMVGAIAAIFLYVPTDRIQGIVQRIFYIHVPLALVTFLAFGITAVASALYLWRNEPKWDRLAYASAELGVLYCTLVLITGPIWAKPIWGTWWTWDARLTTTLILWLIYVAYLMLRNLATDPEQGSRYAAVLGIVGALDIPIINRSVYWWRTIHPAVLVTREGGSGLTDPRMQWTLAVAFVAVLLLFLWLVQVRTRQVNLQARVDSLEKTILESA
ncbi:MAG: cytochrome C biogenesis protein CcmC [Candidatus Binatia bacterium]|nr:MAG: cytochrome C biogenesis protein CcmC [Candidatus Binatia bacterium]